VIVLSILSLVAPSNDDDDAVVAAVAFVAVSIVVPSLWVIFDFDDGMGQDVVLLTGVFPSPKASAGSVTLVSWEFW
jgi:hypothetical protein